MKSKIKFSGIFIIGMILCGTIAAQVRIEVKGGIGYTAINMDKWAGTSANDWGQMSSHEDVTVFFYNKNNWSIGALYGYQYYFWYNVRTPSGSSYYLTTYDVDHTRLLLEARHWMNKAYVQVGFGPHFFDGFTDYGLEGTFGYDVRLTEKLSLPVEVTGSIIFDSDTQPKNITISSGLAYQF